MAIISLTYNGAGGRYKGQIFECLVDDEYHDWLCQFPWRLHNDHGREELKKAYVICDVSKDKLTVLEHHPERIKVFLSGRRPKLRLHRLVYCQHNGIDEGAASFIVDHINGNGLDNRLVNLRRASTAENNYNKRGQRKKDHGIYRVKGGYKAVISHQGKHISSMVYPSKRLAKLAYDELATKYQGVYAVRHYPNGASKQLNFEDLNHGQA